MLIFSSEIQSESSSLASRAEAGYGIETLLIRTTIVVDDCQPKIKAVSKWSSCDAAEAAIGTVEVVARLQKVGEGMSGGIELLADREINLIGFFVARGEILEFRGVIEHVGDARSCPGTKSEIGVVDIAEGLQAVERRIHPAVDGNVD